MAEDPPYGDAQDISPRIGGDHCSFLGATGPVLGLLTVGLVGVPVITAALRASDGYTGPAYRLPAYTREIRVAKGVVIVEGVVAGPPLPNRLGSPSSVGAPLWRWDSEDVYGAGLVRALPDFIYMCAASDVALGLRLSGHVKDYILCNIPLSAALRHFALEDLLLGPNADSLRSAAAIGYACRRDDYCAAALARGYFGLLGATDRRVLLSYRLEQAVLAAGPGRDRALYGPLLAAVGREGLLDRTAACSRVLFGAALLEGPTGLLGAPLLERLDSILDAASGSRAPERDSVLAGNLGLLLGRCDRAEVQAALVGYLERARVLPVSAYTVGVRALLLRARPYILDFSGADDSILLALVEAGPVSGIAFSAGAYRKTLECCLRFPTYYNAYLGPKARERVVLENLRRFVDWAGPCRDEEYVRAATENRGSFMDVLMP